MSQPSDPENIIEQIASHYQAIMTLLGEDTEREGLLKTPQRAAKAIYYCTRGYRQDIDRVINEAIFSAPGNQDLVIVRDIEFYSLCEHHILPFFGHISIGYVPDGKIIGLSKFARIVDMFARRLQVQEALTEQLCSELYRVLGAKGVIVSCRARHLCMEMRGVQKHDATTVTTSAQGILRTDIDLRSQFFQSIR